MGFLRITFFASGENLFTWTNYLGIEPETVDIRTGIDGNEGCPSYPLAQIYFRINDKILDNEIHIIWHLSINKLHCLCRYVRYDAGKTL